MITDAIISAYGYREKISDMIRAKGIDIPQNTKLKHIPQYIQQLEKPDKITPSTEWSQDFYEQCVNESLANYLNDRSKYNGHCDAQGLAEIGWTQEDIDYFQEFGVDWYEEDDDKYLVPEYEKELYRTNAITVSGTGATYTSTLINNNDPRIVEWRNTIKWMPKFTTAALPSTISFRNFTQLIGCPSFNFSNTTNPSYLFSRCINIRCIPPITFKTTANWSGSYMFFECSRIKSIPDTINWDRCTDMSYMFGDCTELLYLPELNIPNCKNMTDAFTNCQNLIAISQITTSDILTSTKDTFAGCRSILGVPYFNTSNCTAMNNMFSNCPKISTVPKYDTSKNRSFATFFRNDSNLLKCPNFDFSGGVTSYNGMFMGCEKLIEIPQNIDFSSCTDVTQMCYRCLQIQDFPYKLNYNSTATSAAEGIKSFTEQFYFCINLKRIAANLYKSTGSTVINNCVFVTDITVEDYDGGSHFIINNDQLFRCENIHGALRGITKNLALGHMRRLSRESMLRILNAVEDVSDYETKPKITFGTESLRNLTNEEKLIATNKGWVLA